MDKKLRGDVLDTGQEKTWCPGCPNYTILDAVKLSLNNLFKKGFKRNDFSIVSGIGCHGKIFDYLNLSGVYSLHGRPLPTAMGIRLGNPNLKVIAFEGDGDAYSEGMSHFIHAGRYNFDMTLIVHNNQSFSLTTGQATPSSQRGYKSRAEPLGKFEIPINPLRLALASGVSFIARANARDPKQTAKIIEKAIQHKGFSFVEIIQDCIIFNLDANNKEERMFLVPGNGKRSKEEASKLIEMYDYDSKKGRIPLGVLFSERRKTFEEQWPQLQELQRKNKGWAEIKK